MYHKKFSNETIFFWTDSNEYDIIITGSIEPVKKNFERLIIDKNKLEIAMARAELNRNKLAEKAEMPIPTICNVYVRGICKPATAGKIAKALGVDVTEILED